MAGKYIQLTPAAIFSCAIGGIDPKSQIPRKHTGLTHLLAGIAHPPEYQSVIRMDGLNIRFKPSIVLHPFRKRVADDCNPIT